MARNLAKPSKMATIPGVGYDNGNGFSKIFIPGRDPIVFQSTASPQEFMRDSVLGSIDRQPLIVDGEPWYAGIGADETDRPQAVHEGSALSMEHRALFLEALDRIDADIAALAMGVPTAQFADKDLIARIEAQYSGTHLVRGREITVGKVGVFDQPIGTARAYVEEQHGKIGDQLMLLVDFGFGTTNVVMAALSTEAGGITINVDRRTAQSFWIGVSQVCEVIQSAVRADAGHKIPVASISGYLRDGRMSIRRGRHDIDLSPFVAEAVAHQASLIESQIKTQFRGVLPDADLILATGGGARLFAKALEAMSDVPVEVMPDSQISNAKGYALLARDYVS